MKYLSLVLLCVLVVPVLAQQSAPPVVALIPSADPPPVPSDLKVTCDTKAEQTSLTCPVIMWNEYEYWVYSFIDNRVAMSIVAYTEDDKLVKRWDKPGARYINDISIDTAGKTFTLSGQAGQKILVKWDELYLPVPPEAGRVPLMAHPKIPDGQNPACMRNATDLRTIDTCYVLEWKQYTYWAYSFDDNRTAMNIVAYDHKRNIAKQWEKPGARYLYKITVDPAQQTVTFWGQADRKIVMKWDELLLK